MIKAVIFDFFGVICSNEYWTQIKQNKGLTGRFEELKRAVSIGEINWQAFLETISSKTGIPVDELKHRYADQQINLELVAYIAELHKNYKTSLLSNVHHELLEPILASTHISEVFDAIVISSREQLVKPEPQIFKTTLRQLGVKAEQTVFIDDRQSNIDAAKSLGMKAILYEDFQQMKQDLEKFISHRV